MSTKKGQKDPNEPITLQEAVCELLGQASERVSNLSDVVAAVFGAVRFRNHEPCGIEFDPDAASEAIQSALNGLAHDLSEVGKEVLEGRVPPIAGGYVEKGSTLL